jgi:hypothetical protein
MTLIICHAHLGHFRHIQDESACAMMKLAPTGGTSYGHIDTAIQQQT